MAEAARTVRHYVSDCLQERHPYDVEKGFAGRPNRDIGLVYNGLQPHTAGDWIASLSDPAVGSLQRRRAVRLLIAHSASQEAKIKLLRMNVVPAVVAALITTPCAEFECQVFALLRSLCIISQGCHVVMEEGGLEAAIRSIQDRRNLAERAEARAAAAQVLYQISFNAAGVRWLLGAEVPPGFELMDPIPSSSKCVFGKKDVIAALVFILENDSATNRKMFLHAVTCLGQLTTQTEGIFAAMEGRAVHAVSSLLHGYVENGFDSSDDDVVSALLVVVTNVSLEQTGVELVDELNTPTDVCTLVGKYYSDPQPASYPLLRSLTSALSAVYKLLSMKMNSMTVLTNGFSRILVIYKFLHKINDVVTAAKHAGREPHPDVIAISKNLVLSTHFAMEVKDVRTFTHSYLSKLDKKEAFYFRRQLFYSTQWEGEFDAAV
ncbi:uncharacterized protein TEOVI_000442800 [Trypanosoma equiperdum]|uniref:Uncharacterized protein n=4 Tax=Trypanozoon TaxID=39700 RepID=Q57ZK0_TRYB2|nr:hypothetical protein, conserved [Trypanosoma brucei gambiense DAL972]XP_843905.1 hypothetical protein, conserved [Trypanosoma brucei brucei TREU927]AAX79482.1 hypothetical protein, conserved [Trypanosoma brucei]RHW73821.1 hypothetical protein DPX39_030030400 [Trypanosoma brucei equiperdum]SCU72844.1 hypothetical protein, conserved [Trypanosoma equiperdum]AAZ10346.1 hypothetical protein, conserved [Trypanosoma brucei brucei TREU927]CBH09989.1 hypothetical protein, conserved [Trypanosoma bru|eukprot:XP_011772280.1 hypothetical protein, conserved [Trypanosoma brucei gambiense DAL972]